MLPFRPLLIILAVAVIGYSALWYTVAFRLEKDMAAHLSAWRDQGLKVDYDTLDVGGFPYRLEMTLTKPRVSTRSGGLSVRAGNLQVISHLWTPRLWVFLANDASGKLAGDAVIWSSATLRGSLRLRKDDRLDLRFEPVADSPVSLDRAPGTGRPVRLNDVFLALLTHPRTEIPRDALFEAPLIDIRLRARAENGLLDFTGQVTGTGISDWTEKTLGRWRDSGGLFTVTALDLMAGGTRFRGEGSLSLDEGFRPLGAFNGSLVQDGRLSRDLAGLGLEPATGDGDIRTDTGNETSLMLQMGVLSVDGIPVSRLPPVVRD